METGEVMTNQKQTDSSRNIKFDVKGKIALVTGSNRGIGKEIVESFIRHGAAKIYTAVRNLDSANDLVQDHGDKIVLIQIDLEKPETITAAASVAKDVQIVVNNAGVLGVSDPLDAESLNTLDYEMNINVYGLLRMAQAFAPILKANGGGAFVQLNSVASVKSFTGLSTYCASKAAAYSFTQALREPFNLQGTAVLSVHPGPIATDMIKTFDYTGDSDPPSVVAESIVESLKAGEFHLFPDAMAKQIESAYQSFAENVIEAVVEV